MITWPEFLRDNPKARAWLLKAHMATGFPEQNWHTVWRAGKYIEAKPRYPHQCLALIEELGWVWMDALQKDYSHTLTIGISGDRSTVEYFGGDDRHHEALQHVLKEEFGDAESE